MKKILTISIIFIIILTIINAEEKFYCSNVKMKIKSTGNEEVDFKIVSKTAQNNLEMKELTTPIEICVDTLYFGIYIIENSDNKSNLNVEVTYDDGQTAGTGDNFFINFNRDKTSLVCWCTDKSKK